MQPKTLTPALPHLGPYAGRIFLGALPTGDVVPTSSFEQPLWLEAAVKLLAGRVGTDDLRVAASLWNKQYNAAVIMGAISAMTLHGIGLDLSLENTAILLHDGVPRAVCVRNPNSAVAYLPRGGAAAGFGAPCDLETLHRTVFTSLFSGHLALINQALVKLCGVSRAILWGNAGNLLADMFDKWAQTGTAPEAVRTDRRLLLEQKATVGVGDPNPMYNGVDYVALSEPDLPALVRVRRTCCQKHLTREAKACYTCPRLSQAERIPLLRESLHKH